MNEKNFHFLCSILLLSTCALCAWRYSTSMQNANELPDDLNTAHEVIVTQSAFIHELSGKNEQLKQELAEAHAAFSKLLAGNRREQLINPAQTLLEFPEDPELQAALEAAKREAEAEIQKITYTRNMQKERAAKLRSDAFPAHLRREEVTVAISAENQQLIDAGKLVVLRYEPKEVLCHKSAEVFVKRFMEPVFASVEAPQIEAFREEMPAALGEQGRYDASVAAAIINGKLGFTFRTIAFKTSSAPVVGRQPARRSTISSIWRPKPSKSCPS